MLSVLIINSDVYERYLKYAYFFNWFEDNSNVAICMWNKGASDETGIDELVPQLFDTVKNASEWNAYIIDEPFFSSEYIKQDFDNYTQYSINPYERATGAENYDPEKDALLRLTYYLGGRGVEQLEYINNYNFRAAKPNQIFLITPRIFENLEMQQQFLQTEIEKKLLSIKTENESDDEKNIDMFMSELSGLSLQYSEFWDRYEYPPNCRFMVFDMPDIDNIKYNDSWFMFWISVMMLVLNTFNSSEIGAYKLYSVGVDISTDNFKQFINKYYLALSKANEGTEKEIENEIGLIKAAMEDTSSTHPDECAPVYVNFPLTEFDNFYPQKDRFGVFKNKPEEDTEVWTEHGEKVKKETHVLFKAVTRGSNEAVDAMNRTLEVDLPLLKNRRLTRYDVEDITDDLNNKEIEMIMLKGKNIASRSNFEKREDEAYNNVKKGMVDRVSSKVYLTLAIVGLLSCLFGMIPFIISSAKFNMSSLVVALFVTFFSCAIVALSSCIALFVQKKKFFGHLDDYSEVASQNIHTVQADADVRSRYLTLLLNYMEKYQMLISGRIDERYMKHLNELTAVQAIFEEALDQCRSIAGLCRVKLVANDDETEYEQIMFVPGEKVYLHEDTDSIHIPLNSLPGRLTPPFRFVDSMRITEETLYESPNYYSKPKNEIEGAKGGKN